MKNTSIIFALFLVSTIANCQNRELHPDRYIIWTDSSSLSIDDFKSNKRPVLNTELSISSHIGAVSACGIQGVLEEYDGQIEIIVNATFDRVESWFDTVQMDSSGNVLLLRHEQGHFDLYEYTARRIRFGVDSLQSINCSEKQKYENLIEKMYDERDELNDIYDKGTAYGTIVQKQEIWDRKIADLLSSLSDYSSSRYDRTKDSLLINLD